VVPQLNFIKTFSGTIQTRPKTVGPRREQEEERGNALVPLMRAMMLSLVANCSRESCSCALPATAYGENVCTCLGENAQTFALSVVHTVGEGVRHIRYTMGILDHFTNFCSITSRRRRAMHGWNWIGTPVASQRKLSRQVA